MKFSHRMIRLALCCAAVGLSVSPATAAITYTFIPDAPSYDISPGGTVDVDVLLQEVADGMPSRLADEGGLGSVEFTLRQGVDPAVELPDMPVVIDSFLGNPDFDGASSALTDGDVGLSLYQEIGFSSPGVTGNPVGNTTTVYLATITLTVPTDAMVGDVTPFTLFDDPTVDDTFTAAFTSPALDVDPGIGASSFNVNVVPEPVTMIVPAMLGLLAVRRRRAVR